jgi:drug/metabolite transporter (DMT)-like permease
MTTYLVALLCVVGIAIGQILFKVSAVALAASGSLFAARTTVPLVAAMCLYGLTSVAWVWVLQNIELGRVYPLMALAFVFVPLGSYIFFGERFQAQYFFGVAVIIIGIIIVVKGKA